MIHLKGMYIIRAVIIVQEKITLKNSDATGYVIPAGPVHLVMAIAQHGMVGCGAFDVAALNNFGYPAARVKPSRGPSITSLDDLLAGEIKDANQAAIKLGIKEGMSGKEALDLLS
jgi:uncharacterized protein YunC (DUF1805 family)